MKKIIALIMSLAMVLAFASCSSTPSGAPATTPSGTTPSDTPVETTTGGEEEDQIYIIMVNALNGHPVYEQQAEAARKAAADYNIKLEIIGPSMGTQATTSDYISALENAVTLGPDAIICEPFDPALFSHVSLAAKNIPIFCTANGTDNEDDYISSIGTDNIKYGITAVDMIGEATGGEANILVVLGGLTTVNQVLQLQGMKERIAEKYPHMKIVDAVADENDLSKAVVLFQDNFNAYPEIDTVVMLEATGGPGAAQVAKEMNKEVRILDIDAVAETIDNIKSGSEWATLAQNFYKRGYESVRMAYEYVDQDGQIEYGKFIDSGTVLITAENAPTYKEDLWAAVKVKGTEW